MDSKLTELHHRQVDEFLASKSIFFLFHGTNLYIYICVLGAIKTCDGLWSNVRKFRFSVGVAGGVHRVHKVYTEIVYKTPNILW
jgi:hypothetical protein